MRCPVCGGVLLLQLLFLPHPGDEVAVCKLRILPQCLLIQRICIGLDRRLLRAGIPPARVSACGPPACSTSCAPSHGRRDRSPVTAAPADSPADGKRAAFFGNGGSAPRPAYPPPCRTLRIAFCSSGAARSSSENCKREDGRSLAAVPLPVGPAPFPALFSLLWIRRSSNRSAAL